MKYFYLAITFLILGGVVLMSSRSIEENKYTGYIVIEECGAKGGLNRLREQINVQIKEGWEPIGGIEVHEGYATCFYQAMVR